MGEERGFGFSVRHRKEVVGFGHEAGGQREGEDREEEEEGEREASHGVGGFELERDWLVKRGFCREREAGGEVTQRKKVNGESVVLFGVGKTGVVGPEAENFGSVSFVSKWRCPSYPRYIKNFF